MQVATWQTPFPVRGGDQFVLCSNGLYDLVRDDEIQHTVSALAPSEAGKKLIALANERGGHDNITVGIIRINTFTTKNSKITKESSPS